MNSDIYPCLWFDNNAAEAISFYKTLFSDLEILGEYGPVIVFVMRGQKIMALNGGPHFPQTEAFSLVIPCENQAEIDFFWNAFTAEGAESMCGWCKDKFGLNWQIVPAPLNQWMQDPEKADRVASAILKMKKLDFGILENA
jgi:predicted 3-demethylubiquinone-9 3-methyltransferase (glyoxalase superfamily)